MKPLRDKVNQSSCTEEKNNNGILTDISQDAVDRLLKPVKFCRIEGPELQGGPKGNEKHGIAIEDRRPTSDAEVCCRDERNDPASDGKVEEKSYELENPDMEDEMDESIWEDGAIPTLNSTNIYEENIENITEGVSIEFDVSPKSTKQKPVRRASAEDKEVAELVHKVHLMCLLGRGRLIDNACNDPLIQASLLSLLPPGLLEIANTPKLTAHKLAPLVIWFHSNFRVGSSRCSEKSFHSALASAIETHEGSPEEVAALSVALFRSLNLTTRFVSILDVVSLKPNAEKSEFISQKGDKAGKGIFSSATLMVDKQTQVHGSKFKESTCYIKDNVCETSERGACRTTANMTTKSKCQLKDSPITGQLNDIAADSLAYEAQSSTSDECIPNNSGRQKRKGDVEFEMQLELALSATEISSTRSNMGSDMGRLYNNSSNSSSFKIRKIRSEETSSFSPGISTAIGSRKVGAPLYWAEIYCSGENLTGKWVHVDATNAIVDGEQKVEAATAACKKTLRYVVAFAGHGAKDVTRRYCMKWHKIAAQRISSTWWDRVLAPLKELESVATGGLVHLKQEGLVEDKKVEASIRSSIEDMELETRALTEPLPTNQQAYKNHQLYAIERWLTKYQILYPKGPIFGFCSGHPVYPRTCVQTLRTKQRWLIEGLQIKANERPAKVLKHSSKLKAKNCETDDYSEIDLGGTVELYGKWQTEPLCLPSAVDGIVPRNERGQVDVWSEKCLPPGTVHLKLPRLVPIAQRLGIDFAPAMVGFERRNGRSVPVFDGLVVCAEFKDGILEAYAEEGERREAEEEKRNERQALSRWYQLLSSIVTRQRLNNCYGDGASSQASVDILKVGNSYSEALSANKDETHRGLCHDRLNPGQFVPTEDHEHIFLTDCQISNEGGLTRVKRCHCGFSIQVEEL